MPEVGSKRILYHRHGLSGGQGHYTRLYRIWLNMRRRCLNQKGVDWLYYGGRGITICEEWSNYANFHDWAMANGYCDDLTIERRDNDGNYEPENCLWATRKQQGRNKRSNRHLTFDGQTKTTAEWSEDLELGSTLRMRLHRGWSIEKALTTKVEQVKEEK